MFSPDYFAPDYFAPDYFASADSSVVTAVYPVSVMDIKRRLVGLDAWLSCAAVSLAQYNDTAISEQIPAMIRNFEREAQFRINQVQVVSRADGVYADVNADLTLDTALPVKHEPAYHYYWDDATEYFKVTLNERPVRRVQRIRVMFHEQDKIFDVPPEWISFDSNTGRLWLVPVRGALTITGLGVSWSVLNMSFGGKPYIPMLISVDYIAGLPDNWYTLGEWADMRRALSEYCALAVLNDISELYDAGIVTKSVGDGTGLSQTISYERFARRKEELQMSVERFIQTLAKTETPILLGVV